MWYTVVYTQSLRYAGSLVHVEHIKVNQPGELFQQCEAIGINSAQIVHIFAGKHESIASDWSKL